MLSISVIGAVLVIVPVALGTVHMEGRCPNYIPVPNFNRSQFLGEWYEIQRLELDELLNADCVHVNYAMNVDGSTVNVRQRMQILENSPRTIEKRGYARYIDPTGRLVMIYNETDPIASIFDYYITHTDYHGYLIATSCENVNNTHYAESAWVMSRGRTLPPSALTVVNQATQHWNPAYFRHTNQDTRVCSSSHKMALASIILLMALLTILFLR